MGPPEEKAYVLQARASNPHNLVVNSVTICKITTLINIDSQFSGDDTQNHIHHTPKTGVVSIFAVHQNLRYLTKDELKLSNIA